MPWVAQGVTRFIGNVHHAAAPRPEKRSRTTRMNAHVPPVHSDLVPA